MRHECRAGITGLVVVRLVVVRLVVIRLVIAKSVVAKPVLGFCFRVDVNKPGLYATNGILQGPH